ncbi:MAG: glycosyl hydrolase, partial [Tepidisphaeraceae bacterium]
MPARPAAAADNDALAWPPITQLNQQWTRWWWMGSAVDQPNITRILQQYHDAGIGGVEICPIYGAYGYESRYINFLSPKWMDMLAWTGSETQRLGMGMDMTTGTGWPMGGPNVSVDDASSTDSGQRFEVAGGTNFSHTFTNPPREQRGGGVAVGPTTSEAQRNINALTSGIPVDSAPPRIATVMAYSSDGQKIDLTRQVNGTTLNWDAPAGTWVIYAIVQSGPAMKVKRPAPGGEGNVQDPFSVKSMDDYLAGFDKAFANYKGVMPQAQFHDSYEYVGDWTNDLFDKFKALRGYDLRDQLPAFFGDTTPEQNVRVINDYRQTMADLHMAYVQRWIDWCHAHGMLAREQAHGAPANTLDLYGLADMPETETFGSADEAAADGNFPMNKFASSAAHVVGRQIASSESFTWLGQHFQVSFADVKPVADYLLLSGINHMLFHGMAYSPEDAPWPGWLFYASVDFNPNGGLWHDMSAYTAYVARCQSILQSGKPSNDVLLYFPVNDIWQTPITRTPLIGFVIGGQWMRGTPFYETATALQKRGFGVDYISDAQLANVKFENGALTTGGAIYHAIVVPPCKLMPPETMEALVNLAKAGATVVFQDGLPTDVPGLSQLDARRAELGQETGGIQLPGSDVSAAPQGTPVGKGYFWVGRNVNSMLAVAGVEREPMLDLGLQFIRRTHEHGYHYFIANRGGNPVDGWVTLSTPAKSVEILDPMHPE